jgi:hypothetical protein
LATAIAALVGVEGAGEAYGLEGLLLTGGLDSLRHQRLDQGELAGGVLSCGEPGERAAHVQLRSADLGLPRVWRCTGRDVHVFS